MRLAVVTTSYPLTPTSSSGIFVARLIRSLPAPVEATVITPASRQKDNAPSSVKTFRYAPRLLQVLAHEPGGIPVALKTYRWSYLLIPGFLLAMLISCIRYGRGAQLIHANWAICGCIAGLAGRLLRIPVITTLRGADVERAKGGGLDLLIMKWCASTCTAMVCVSHSIEKWLRTQPWMEGKKIIVIENGVDDALLELTIERPRPADTPLRLVTIGSLIPRKAVDRAITALSRLGDRNGAVLTIVGDGSERDRLTALAAKLGVAHRIRFTGALAPSEIMAELAQADAFVLSSNSEGRPNALLEAMAAGLPVAASDIPGVNELISDGQNGYLFAPDDIETLVQRLRVLRDNPKMRTCLGRAARETIVDRRLHWRETGARYFQLYRRVIENDACAE